MKKIDIIDQNGQQAKIPKAGSLGLLALGHKGLIAWRNVRKKELEELKKGKKAE